MKLQFSAGGVVFKRPATNDQRQTTLILLAQHSQHHGWVFPKGLIDNKESKEDAALREVKEETGAKGKIIKFLTPVTYWFVFEGEKVKKTVYYFLMEYVGGDIAKHDDEMENVEWLPKDKVEERLTYKSDKKVWHEARKLFADSYKL
jgi:8-oxo-dGTP diphosphatase